MHLSCKGNITDILQVLVAVVTSPSSSRITIFTVGFPTKDSCELSLLRLKVTSSTLAPSVSLLSLAIISTVSSLEVAPTAKSTGFSIE